MYRCREYQLQILIRLYIFNHQFLFFVFFIDLHIASITRNSDTDNIMYSVVDYEIRLIVILFPNNNTSLYPDYVPL